MGFLIPNSRTRGSKVTDVETELQERAGAAKLPTGSEVTVEEQKVQKDELLSNPAKLKEVEFEVAQVPTTGLEVTVPQTKSAEKYTAQTIQGTPEAVAAQGKLSSEAVVGDITGTVSEQSVAQAAQGQVSEESTVQYQIGELFKSFEEGKPPPAWAAPAMRAVGAVMQSRGLGASSMASAAITQAIV